MKMAMIGAGSGFGSTLSVDILSRPELAGSTIALCDTDDHKLGVVQKYLDKVIESNKLTSHVIASTERREVLKDADFVIIAVSIGGPAYYDYPVDEERAIPRKYGLQPTVGDTIGPSGIFRALRSGPEMIRMMDDINELAPKAVVLNYTNPMAILTKACQLKSDVPVIGLCHSVQGTSKELAKFIDAPYEEVTYWVAGINHMAWFLEFNHKGEDAYPRLHEAMKDPEKFAKERVRFEIMRDFGYFVTESSLHMSEYVPWYQHNQPIMDEFAARKSTVRERRQAWLKDMGIKAEQVESLELNRTHEYASEIIEAMVTDVPIRFNGNVLNYGLISNLPEGCCVEVPCMTDGQGVHPCAVGALPLQCVALCQSNVSVQELAVKAIVERDREAALHAVFTDPIVGATINLDQARAMFDELWEMEGDLLKDYR